jgi:hypothetical protein
MRVSLAKRMKRNIPIKSASDLVTSREKTRAGFISLALEKNYLAVPYVEEAKALKSLASRVSKPNDLLQIQDLRVGLLTASGLSEKSLNYLTEDDKTLAIKEMIEKFLEPAGNDFIDELVYRYLLTKGDALGRKARNLAGVLGERKFLRSLLSVFNLSGINYSTGTAQAVLDYAPAGARLIFSCGWHITRDGKDIYSPAFKAFVKVFGWLARLTRFADLDDQAEACRRVFASDTRWTVVRGSDLEEGESQGLPVWSRHVGDPILESNLTRRIDFALFMVEALKNDELIREAPAIVGCRTPSALAHAADVGTKGVSVES